MAAANHPITLSSASAALHASILTIPIVAITIAPGRGDIGVVRVPESDARTIMCAACGCLLAPRQVAYLPFLDADDNAIDHGIALWFLALHSYMGEGVLELQGHGDPAMTQLLLRRCLTAGREIGLHVAEPDKFTRHTFLSNKMGLAQAETVVDLIEASIEVAARSTTRSLDGAFPQTVYALVERAIHLRMLVEAALDFPEGEVDFLEASDMRG